MLVTTSFGAPNCRQFDSPLQGAIIRELTGIVIGIYVGQTLHERSSYGAVEHARSCHDLAPYAKRRRPAAVLRGVVLVDGRSPVTAGWRGRCQSRSQTG